MLSMATWMRNRIRSEPITRVNHKNEWCRMIKRHNSRNKERRAANLRERFLWQRERQMACNRNPLPSRNIRGIYREWWRMIKTHKSRNKQRQTLNEHFLHGTNGVDLTSFLQLKERQRGKYLESFRKFERLIALETTTSFTLPDHRRWFVGRAEARKT